jgi:hypothetical protein
MFLAFSDYTIAVVAAEVGEPEFWDTPDAVGFCGSAKNSRVCEYPSLLIDKIVFL